LEEVASARRTEKIRKKLKGEAICKRVEKSDRLDQLEVNQGGKEKGLKKNRSGRIGSQREYPREEKGLMGLDLKEVRIP